MEVLPAKNIVSKTKNPSAWFGGDYNMNIYRGCSHGCIYCDSRSDCYRNPSFDVVKIKENACKIIREDLRRKVTSGVISTGAMSDPYNPFEEKLCLTRSALKLINAYGFGVAISTKSALITRDIDILQDIKTHSPVIINMTITTADPILCGKIEPHVSISSERFKALKILSDAGIFCGVLMMPLLPFINDSEENIYEIIKEAKNAGAKFVYPGMGMTLRAGNREYYFAKLDEMFPHVKQKYIENYSNDYICTVPNAEKLWNLFKDQCMKQGLLYKMKDIISAYKIGYNIAQMSLF